MAPSEHCDEIVRLINEVLGDAEPTADEAPAERPERSASWSDDYQRH